MGADSQSLNAKNSAKADATAALESHTDARDQGATDLMGNAKYIAALHGECDWLITYFDARREARAGEVDSLKRAKAVLSGADYSLIQRTRSHRFLGSA